MVCGDTLLDRRAGEQEVKEGGYEEVERESRGRRGKHKYRFFLLLLLLLLSGSQFLSVGQVVHSDGQEDIQQRVWARPSRITRPSLKVHPTPQ